MPDSSGATVLDDLPEWLVVDEILVRLRPKDVFRCRAVRKSWRSGTSTDRFILDHQRHQPSLPIVEHNQKGICRLPVLGGAGAGAGASTDKLIRSVLWDAGIHGNSNFPPALHAACDGLLILSSGRPDFYICNPATRKCASLPHPPSDIDIVNVAGFYRHDASGEHRVLWAVYSTAIVDDDEVEWLDYFVLTVGSDQPRGIECPIVPDEFVGPQSSEYVHHRGSLHWATGLSITVFDTVAETFRQMSRPTELGLTVSLLDMRGALALYGTSSDCLTFDVWVLQDYDSETWGFLYQINLLEMVASPQLDFGQLFPRMAMINERELLIQMGPRLLHCDIGGVFLGNVEIEEHLNCVFLTRHRLQENMFSLPLFETQEDDAVNIEPPFLIML